MKKSKLMLAFMSLALAGTSLVGCNQATPWDFTVKAESNSIRVLETTNVVVTCEKKEEHKFAFTSSNATVASVDVAGKVSALSTGEVTITVTADEKPELSHSVKITVLEFSGATGAFTYAAADYDEKAEILGELEKYALDNHFSGLPLFENGGLVMYSPRVTKGTTNYITGYGFGILGEGDITSDLDYETKTEWKRYYHTASASDSYDINDWDADGSEVSDRASYIRSTYFDVKMNATKDGYDWYPVLAKEMPVAVEPEEDGRSTTWKFKVRTGEDGLKYSTLSQDPALSAFNGRGVTLDDYLYTFAMLLNGKDNLYRGAELAGKTDASGFVGAAAYFNATKQSGIDIELFKRTVGISVDSTDNSIQFSLLGPVTPFYAMYYLASGLYQPIPADFITAIGGPKNYGRAVEGTSRTPVDTALSLAPYTLEFWEKNTQIAFKRNPSWFQFNDPALSSRYKIQGIHIRVNTAAAQDADAIFNMFIAGQIDAAGIPSKYVKQYKNDPRTTTTTGDSVFKLNINSCNEEQWEEKFGENGTITQTDPANYWDVKPWMSNSWFLDGIFLSLNRQEFADNRGVIPSANYFASAYLINPEEGISYNNTDAHKNAVAGYYPETHGYNLEASKTCFKTAVDELVANGDIELGTAEKPTEISFEICWMYQSDIQEYGEDIVKYIQDAFNDASVCGGKVKLTVTQTAVTTWSDVYYKRMMVGQFDLAFGSISGNTLNPLNFMEVLKSDNSSGFTLNWGPDTNICTQDNHIEYDGEFWSFDALWAAADHGAAVENGCNVAPIEVGYLDMSIEGNWTKDAEGNTNVVITIDFSEAINFDGVKLTIQGITLYDGPRELDLSELITNLEEDPEDDTVCYITLTFDDDTLAELNAILAADLGAPEGTIIFLPNYFGDYFEFVFYYSFDVLGVASDTYYEIFFSYFPGE